MTLVAFPHSRELERGLLGALTLDPQGLAEVAAVLEPADFYDPYHAELFESLIRLQQKGHRYDQTLLVELLPKIGFDMQTIGGISGLLEMGDHACIPIQVSHYAEEIRESSLRRAALRQLNELVGGMHQPHETPTSQIDRALSRLVQLRNSNTRRKSTSLATAVSQVADEAEELRRNGGVSRGIATGFSNIDSGNCSFPGFWPGELIILCGHTSHGKTTFALNVVLKAIKRGIPVAYFSAEMTASSLARRLVSIEAKIDATEQRAGRLVDSVQLNWDRAADRLSRMPLQILDGGVTIEEVAAHTRIIDQGFRTQRGRGIGMVVVDYLQRLRPTDSRLSREEQVAHMSWSAKSLAIEMDVPVLCLAQPNREAFRSTDKRPKLHHLRDSGRIEQDADTVMSVYWPWKERDTSMADDDEGDEGSDVSTYEVAVLKCRNGGLGNAVLVFEPKITRLTDYIPPNKELRYG